MAVVASTSALLSSAFTRFTRLFFSQQPKSFSDLPDDVILEVFTCMDFSSIIALRQTCRKCYRVSKTTALWLDVCRWITKDAEDWRTPLAKSHLTLDSDGLEREVTRLVRFECNWSQGHKGVQKTSSFYPDDGYAFTFIPGGRWFLKSNRCGILGVICYDLDAVDIQKRMLITQKQHGQLVWAMDSAIDSWDTGLESDLAVEFMTRDHFDHDCSQPRNLTVWRLTVDQDDCLSAKLIRSVPVFRMTPYRRAISLAGDFLLRLSLTLSGHPVFTVHRWNPLDNNKVTHSILIPIRREMPRSDIKLLPDGRILSVSVSWIEIYTRPNQQWEESLVVPKDVPRSAPWWVYEYAPPLYPLQHNVSQLLHARFEDWATFSIHNGQNLFNFRIPLHGEQEPEVKSMVFAQLGAKARIGLSTSRAIISTLDENEVTFVTLDCRSGMGSLRAFAGVPPGDKESESRSRATETRFESPYPATANPWLIDEKSGRVLCRLAMNPDQYMIFYFVD